MLLHLFRLCPGEARIRRPVIKTRTGWMLGQYTEQPSFIHQDDTTKATTYIENHLGLPCVWSTEVAARSDHVQASS